MNDTNNSYTSSEGTRYYAASNLKRGRSQTSDVDQPSFHSRRALLANSSLTQNSSNDDVFDENDLEPVSSSSFRRPGDIQVRSYLIFLYNSLLLNLFSRIPLPSSLIHYPCP